MAFRIASPMAAWTGAPRKERPIAATMADANSAARDASGGSTNIAWSGLWGPIHPAKSLTLPVAASLLEEGICSPCCGRPLAGPCSISPSCARGKCQVVPGGPVSPDEADGDVEAASRSSFWLALRCWRPRWERAMRAEGCVARPFRMAGRPGRHRNSAHSPPRRAPSPWAWPRRFLGQAPRRGNGPQHRRHRLSRLAGAHHRGRSPVGFRAVRALSLRGEPARRLQQRRPQEPVAAALSMGMLVPLYHNYITNARLSVRGELYLPLGDDTEFTSDDRATGDAAVVWTMPIRARAVTTVSPRAPPPPCTPRPRAATAAASPWPRPSVRRATPSCRPPRRWRGA